MIPLVPAGSCPNHPHKRRYRGCFRIILALKELLKHGPKTNFRFFSPLHVGLVSCGMAPPPHRRLSCIKLIGRIDNGDRDDLNPPKCWCSNEITLVLRENGDFEVGRSGRFGRADVGQISHNSMSRLRIYGRVSEAKYQKCHNSCDSGVSRFVLTLERTPNQLTSSELEILWLLSTDHMPGVYNTL